MEIWASAQVPSPRSDLISQNERRGGAARERRRRRAQRAQEARAGRTSAPSLPHLLHAEGGEGLEAHLCTWYAERRVYGNTRTPVARHCSHSSPHP